jgi:hypothetical protein
VFSRPEIKQLLNQYVYVQLYTDKIPPSVKQPATSVEENQELQYERFGTGTLPLYVILKPDGKDGQEIARFEEGKINDVGRFADFLQQPLRSEGVATAQR